MYFCSKCKKRHRTGKIYEEHLVYKEKKESTERQKLLLKLAKINRIIAFRGYNRKDIEFLKTIKRQIEEKLKC